MSTIRPIMPDDRDRALVQQAADAARASELAIMRLDTRFEDVVADVERHRVAIYGRDGTNGLNNRVSLLTGGYDLLQKRVAKAENSLEMLTSPGKALEVQGIRWRVIGEIVVAILAVAGVALDLFF